MDAMNLMALLIVAALTAFAVSVLMYNNLFRRPVEACEKHGDKMEGKEEAEAAKKPLTVDSVKAALRFHGFSPEALDENEPNLFTFKTNDTSFRMTASNLPFLVLELGYKFDPAVEDVELMKSAAAEITAGIYIGKVNIYADSQVLIFGAEWLCDSYAQLRDRLQKYLEIVCESQKRFTETYDKMKEDKKKMEEQLSKSIRIPEMGSSKTKILS